MKEYRDLILKQEGLTVEKWKSDPGSLWRPDSRGVASQVLFNTEGSPLGTKLAFGLRGLITELENTKRTEVMADLAKGIFDFREPKGSELDWTMRIFNDNTLSWALIYLDGLEVNLQMIKASVNAGYK